MPIEAPFIYNNPTRILCGGSALVHLPFELNRLGVDLPFVLCDSALGGAMIRKLTEACKGSGITLAISDDVPAAPDQKKIRQLAALFRHHGCNGLVAIGQDDVVNCARLLALALLDPDMDIARFAGHNRIDDQLIPILQIPSGLYSGSAALPMVHASQWKASSIYLLPPVALLDPDLFKPAGQMERISCALFSLSLCMESIAAALGNPFTESLAAGIVKLTFDSLLSLSTCENSVATECLLTQAQLISGSVAAGSRPAILPLFSQALAKECELSEGIICGLLLPYVLEILARQRPGPLGGLLAACRESDFFAACAEALKAPSTINAVYALMHSLHRLTAGKIPTTLEQAKVPWNSLERVAHALKAYEHGIFGWDSETCLEMLTHAWRGVPISVENQAFLGDRNT